MSPSHPPATVECYTRAAPQGTSIEGTVETLRGYRDRGVIEDLTLELWPDEVGLEGYTEGTPHVARYRRFRAWAGRADVSLRPAFTVRERGSLIDDRTDAVLVLPERCLAVRVDGELATVAPHRSDGTTYTVEDALADLGRLGPELAARASVADSATDHTTTAASTTRRSE